MALPYAMLDLAPPIAVVAAVQAEALRGAGPARAGRRVRLSVTATINGSPAGDITVETDTAGNAAVDPVQLIALLDPVLAPATLASLQPLAAGGAFVPLSDLASHGFEIAFDLAALRLNIVVPLDARAISDLAIVDRRQYRRAGLTAPENFAAGLTFTLADRIEHVGNIGNLDREPFNLLVEGFANYGGIDGFNLAFQAGLREGGSLARQRTTLFHDDVGTAIRYSLGDLDPQSFGSYAVPISLIGIGVERLYQTIQPFRNLRPAGRGALALERPSRVDVLVNGVLYRSLDLAPGQYNLRDFPFLDGLNEVQLVVRDETGREETIGLSFFSDIELLESGLSIFSAAAGLRQKRFGNFLNTAYRDSPTFTGFYLRGITDRVTLGGAAQVDKDNGLFNALAVVATPFGLFGFEGAVDLNQREAIQGAFILSYRLNTPSIAGRSGGLNVDFQYRTARFSPMAEAGTQRLRYSWDLNARYQTALDTRTSVSVIGGYSRGRDGFSDLRIAGGSVSRRFRRINANLTYAYRHDDRGTDHRGLLSLSLAVGRNQSARAAYDTRHNRVSANYERSAFEGLDQTSIRAELARNDFGQAADIEVEHFSNRFRAVVRHSYDGTNGPTRQFTDVAASFGIGFADGRFALGRDAARGFAIVDGHRTLGDAPITVSDSFSLGPTARTGALGPALVPTRRGYQPNSLRVAIRDLPVGYDIGPGRYDILPGAANGYAILVGSAASRTVLGRLIAADGEPLAFVAGLLEPISGAEAQPAQFFTNRTGRLVASRVAPGRYRLVLIGETASLGEIDIPVDGEGIVDIGEMRTGAPR